jgi:hypothetical protein
MLHTCRPHVALECWELQPRVLSTDGSSYLGAIVNLDS